MTSQRMIGVVLLVVGIILLVVGLNSSHSFADKMSDAFTGRFTETTTWYLLGGVVAALLGAMMLFLSLGGRRT